MAKIYANLIINRIKTIDDVPSSIRSEVQSILERKNLSGG